MPTKMLSILFIPVLFSCSVFVLACSKKPAATATTATPPVAVAPSTSASAPASVVTPAPATTFPPVNVVRIEKKLHTAKAPAIRIEYPRLVLSNGEATTKLDRLLQDAVIPSEEVRANYRRESDHSFHNAKCTSALAHDDLFSVRCVTHYSIGGADEPRVLEGHTYDLQGTIREIDLEKELFEKEAPWKQALDNFWDGKPLDTPNDWAEPDYSHAQVFAISEKGLLLTYSTETYGEDPKPKVLPWKTIGKMLAWRFRERFL